MSENELYHHGIKGQRWGVRRFQSQDGTLTDAGKKRYKAYKKDWKEYDKLNRHVSAAQKHLKEEGVMLDRVRDKYQSENRKYQKVLSKSSGLFGLKGADKAEAVAKAQYDMDKVGKDYETAAGAYGLAKKIASEDTKTLKLHVDNMIRNYGKGSINELKTETVKMGQNKLQKLMQGAPASVIFSKGRETEEFVKTGKTLADMPVVGNLYTSKYIAEREFDLKKRAVENAVNSAKRGGKGKDKPKYLNDDYFDDVSSVTSSREKSIKEAKKNAKRAPYVANVKKLSDEESKRNEKEANAKAKQDRNQELFDRAQKEYANAVSAQKVASKLSPTARKYANNAVKKSSKKVKSAHKQLKDSKDEYTKILKENSDADKALKKAKDDLYRFDHPIKSRLKRSARHSATYSVVRSDELYHHGIKGQRWGVRRYQNPDGTLTAKGKKRKEKLYAKAEKEYEKGINSKYQNKIDPSNTEFQKKLLALKKKEIDEGFDYYEHRVNKNAIIGQLIGGIPGAAIGVVYTGIKYRSQGEDRKKLMSEARKIELARQEAHRRIIQMQREIDTQNMFRNQMEMNQQMFNNSVNLHNMMSMNHY